MEAKKVKMKNVFIMTYCGNPRNYDILRTKSTMKDRTEARVAIMCEVLASNNPEDSPKSGGNTVHLGIKSCFFYRNLWYRAMRNGTIKRITDENDLLLYVEADFKSPEFLSLIKG